MNIWEISIKGARAYQLYAKHFKVWLEDSVVFYSATSATILFKTPLKLDEYFWEERLRKELSDEEVKKIFRNITIYKWSK